MTGLRKAQRLATPPPLARSDGRLHILLVFSPLFESPHPYLAVPHLKAFLAANGCAVSARDFNGAFWRLGKDGAFLDFVEEMFLRRLQVPATSPIEREDRLAKQLGLAAVASLRSDLQSELGKSGFHTYSRKMFCLVRGFGFPRHHLYNHDFFDFLDDYMIFQGEAGNFDPRFPWRAASSIDQRLCEEDFINNEINIYLSVMEKFLLDDILQIKPDIIGISIPTNEQVIPALSLASLARRALPHAHITLGGAFISHMEESSARTLCGFSFVDSVVLFEGEIPLLSLVNALERGQPLANVPNLIFKVRSQVYKNRNCEPIDLLKCPTPDYGDFTPLLKDEYALSVYAARGCYWGRCNYCNYVVLGAEGADKRYANIAAEHVVNQLEFLQRRYDVSEFKLVTEAFPPHNCRSTAHEILKRGLKVSINTWVRAEAKFTADLSNLMASAGLDSVTVGVESFDDRVLKEMDKGYTGRQAADILNNMIDAGIAVHINMIVGYPTESVEECRSSLQMLESEVGFQRLAGLSVFPFVLFNNIGVYARPDRYGLVIEERDCPPKQIFHKGVFVRYRPTVGMHFGEIAQLAAEYAARYEASGVARSAERIRDGAILAANGDIAVIRVDSSKEIGRGTADAEWVTLNFKGGSMSPVPDAWLPFLVWFSERSRPPIDDCLDAAESLCQLTRPEAAAALDAMAAQALFWPLYAVPPAQYLVGLPRASSL